MQRFNRGNVLPPAILRSPEANRARQAMRDYMLSGHDRRLQTSAPRSELPLEDSSLLEAVALLFGGKCAFCEAHDSVLPYRFRPAAEARPFESTDENWHLYYAWLADAWENIYAICPTCRPDDPGFFPVQGSRARLPTPTELDKYVKEGRGLWGAYPPWEKPELLDPCVENDFAPHLHPQADGVLVGLSSRGTATINHFRLNRPERVAQRAAHYRAYFETLVGAEPAKPGQPDLIATDPFLLELLAFGGTWYLLLRRLGRHLNIPKSYLNFKRIRRRVAAIARDPNGAARLRDAWQRLEDEDARGITASTPEATPAPVSQARITRVELANFKAIERLTLNLPDPGAAATTFDREKPAPSLLILGENAAGKSSILEAIALALSDPAAREELDHDRDGLILNPAYLGAPGSRRPDHAEVIVTLNDGRTQSMKVTQDFITDSRKPDDERVAVFAYGAFRQYQDRTVAPSAGSHIRNLFDGSELSHPERWLLKLHQVRFAEVVRALREILSISVRDMSDEREFDVIERDMKKKRCYLVTEVEDARGERSRARTPLSAVSSGFRSVLAMACDIMRGLLDREVQADPGMAGPATATLATTRGVILIDEVEAHLHPRWKMQIMRGLRRALPNMTIIATTHDPLCLRGMNEGEVVVLQRVATRDSAETSDLPELVEQLVQLPNMSELRVEQLLTSDFFQLYSTDAPEIDARLAKVGDLLAKRNRGEALDKAELDTVDSFEKDVAAAMPIGFSSAHRLVQEAVADYLKERRRASEARMRELRAASKARIVRALKGI